MHRLISAFIISFLAGILIVPQAVAASPKWETVSVSAPSAHPALADAMDAERFEVYTKDNYIYIYTPKAVSVKVFSILGQLICESNVQPGISRLRIPSRGIYILKADAATRRVTI